MKSYEKWRLHSRCRGVEPAMFMPKRGQSTKEPKEICAKCPVRAQCSDYALGLSLERPFKMEPHGIWGGMSDRERRDYRKTVEYEQRLLALRDELKTEAA